MKPGDVVQLRSGGQRMTVESVDAQGRIHCVWFAETGAGYLNGIGMSYNYASTPSIGVFAADTLKNV